MTGLEKRKLERIRYWEGQMLRSRDFRGLEDIEAQRRWWHNRAIHNAYGVAEGFACQLVPVASPDSVVVSPGLAYDAFGRELILERAQTVAFPLPATPSATITLRLVARYKSLACGIGTGEISDVCWTQNGAMQSGTVELVWRPASTVQITDGVAICGITLSGTPPAFGLDSSFAQFPARPVARPLLAGGTTIPGNTAWQPWTFSRETIGAQTWIDTSAAGFTRVPCYFAWLQGSLLDAQGRFVVRAIFPSITDEATNGFTFRVWPAISFDRSISIMLTRAVGTVSTFFNAFSILAQQQRFYVSWVGCQMPVPVSRCVKTAAPVIGNVVTGFRKI